MIRSNTQWQDECCQHEDQIALLQQKLMEMHEKLIQQLDVCREQELTIIDLRKNRVIGQDDRKNNMNAFKYESFGYCSGVSEKAQQNVDYPSNEYDSFQSQQNKNQILQADLQAMRTRVLAEITEKNTIRQQMEELHKKYKKELSMQVKKFEGMQIVYKKLQDKMTREKENRGEVEIIELKKKVQELEYKYQKQRQRTLDMQSQKREFNQRIRSLENKLQQNEKNGKIEKMEIVKRNQKIEKDHYFDKNQRGNYSQKIDKFNKIQRQNKQNVKGQIQNTTISDQMKQITNLKVQIGTLNKNIQIRQQQFIERGDERRKKRQFPEARDMIKIKQQNQIFLRSNRR